jgi:hypothetical protein
VLMQAATGVLLKELVQSVSQAASSAAILFSSTTFATTPLAFESAGNREFEPGAVSTVPAKTFCYPGVGCVQPQRKQGQEGDGSPHPPNPFI